MARRAQGSPLDPAIRASLKAYFPDFDLGAVRLHAGLPRHVPRTAGGYASRDDIYLAAGWRPRPDAESLALLAHELVHVRQYRERGAWRFRLAYVRQYLAGRLRGLGHDAAYRDISFERDARAVEARVRADLAGARVHA